MLIKGDRIRQKRIIEGFDYVGTVFDVTQITPDGMIVFSHRYLGTGLMSHDEFINHFTKTKWTDWAAMRDCTGEFQYRTDGKRVVVRRNGISACSSCHALDEFNLQKGILLSLARLRVKEIKAAM